MNFKLITVVIVALFGLIVLFVIGLLIYKFYTYRTDTILVNDFVITDQWQEIEVKHLVPPLSQDRNSIVIAVPASFETFDFRRGIVAPDGTVIEPEVEAIDTDGNSHLFNRTAARRTSNYEMTVYNPYPELQKGIQIERIRIRSNHEFRAPVILWSSYDIKDLP
ncbi:MAG: hypothetical protein JFAIHJKO_02630 [Pyrinomonadaceae bacterium]|nr:hypothetical protein [Pyrinomonadaceae bacterium]